MLPKESLGVPKESVDLTNKRSAGLMLFGSVAFGNVVAMRKRPTMIRRLLGESSVIITICVR